MSGENITTLATQTQPTHSGKQTRQLAKKKKKNRVVKGNKVKLVFIRFS